MNLARNHGQGDVQHMLWVVRRVVVNDASSGVVEPAFEQAGGLLSLGFNVGNVGHAGPLKRRTVVHHALEHEGGNSVVCPAVLKGQAFDDDQRQVVLLSEVDGVLEGVVPLASSRGCHPIHHDFTLFVGDAVNLEAAARDHEDPPR